MTVVLVGNGNVNLISAIKSKGIQVIESATDYCDPYLPATFEDTNQYVDVSLPYDQMFDIDDLITPEYKPTWGAQGLLYRYNPKAKHNQIKPRIGYKSKRYNRKAFPKTRINFR